MGAYSVTGTGPGASNKVGTKELAVLANGPAIVASGYMTGAPLTSPPTTTGLYRFPKPLDGPASDYVVIITPHGAETAYVSDLIETGSGNFAGFGVVTSGECDVMFIVAKVGIRPDISVNEAD